MFEKELAKYFIDIVKDGIQDVEKDIEARIAQIMRTKILTPIDLVRRQLMFAVPTVLLISAGLLFIVAGITALAIQTIPIWVSLLMGGGVMIVLGAFFAFKLATIPSPVEAVKLPEE